MPLDLPEINGILQSGALAYGLWGRKFEQSLKEFIGCSESVLTTNSFSAAIQVVLLTLGIQEGDEIIASPQSCLASTQPLATYGAKVVWADIDPSRGTLSPDSVKTKITSKTRIIFHNHHCGYPGYIDEINQIAKEVGLIVIDDCIESFGAEYKGNKLGNVGTDISIFSFQSVRLPNTIDGGAIIFKDYELHKQAIKIRDLGVDRSIFRDNMGEISPISDVPIKGIGATMYELNSYIGYCQASDLTELYSQQRANAKKWDAEIAMSNSLRSINSSDIKPSYWVYGLLADNKQEAMRQFRDAGYYASSVHLPNTYYSIFGAQEELKGVKEFYKKFIAIPCGWWFEK